MKTTQTRRRRPATSFSSRTRWLAAATCLLALQAGTGLADVTEGMKPKYRIPTAAPDEFKRAGPISWQKAAVGNMKKSYRFLAENKVRRGVVTLKSGLQYNVLKQSLGERPNKTDTVQVRYVGSLMDGNVFASSPSDQPATVPIARVIPAWQEALERMTVGSKWKLFVPPQLGYGQRGKPPAVGPGEALIYELELVAIKPTAIPTRRTAPQDNAANMAKSAP